MPVPATAAAPPTTPTGPTPDLTGRCAVLLHAHPDDEAIFTAATMHRLARAGARVVLVTATAGELGPVLRRLRPGETLAARRRAELERACELLGVARLVLLGHRDSGMAGWDANAHPDALAAAPTAAVARRLADLCAAEGAEALVHYDPGGIYGHPDHVAVHRVGAAAAALAGITAYEATVDRARPRGRRTHLVDAAAAGAPVGWAPPAHRGRRRPGRPAGQAGRDGRARQPGAAAAVRRAGFAAAYGREWYRRDRPGLLDEVAAGTPRVAGALVG